MGGARAPQCPPYGSAPGCNGSHGRECSKSVPACVSHWRTCGCSGIFVYCFKSRANFRTHAAGANCWPYCCTPPIDGRNEIEYSLNSASSAAVTDNRENPVSVNEHICFGSWISSQQPSGYDQTARDSVCDRTG